VILTMLRSGTVENFVGIHPSIEGNDDQKSGLLEQFGHFHPQVVDVLR
jgi:hypothetical protein